MANYTVTDSDLTSIANAIRTKGGTQASLEYPTEFISAINAIPTGSSVEVDSLSVSQNGTYTAQSGHAYSPVTVSVPQTQIDSLSVTQNGTYTAQSGHAYSPVIVAIEPEPPAPFVKKQVTFIDYDGTLLYSYAKAEIDEMTSESDLPANPTHTGLTAQGWNWTLAEIKAQLTAVPTGEIYVGQSYVTTSGKTEIDVIIPEGRLSPLLTLAVAGSVSVDFGDNTQPTVVFGNSTSSRTYAEHTYAAPGSYTITIQVTSGTFMFYGDASLTLLRKNGNSGENFVYSNCVKHIRIGSNVTDIGDYAFYRCSALETITIPNTITNARGNTFRDCYSLKSVTIPSGPTAVGQSCFYYCESLESVSIPKSVSSFGNSSFSDCASLMGLTIPTGTTSIPSYMFERNYSFERIGLPNTIKTIGQNSFQYCYALKSVNIPNGVTIIYDNAFAYCYSLESVTIPSTFTTNTYEYQFTTCRSLRNVTIESGLTNIGNRMFSACPAIAKLTIPSTVTKFTTYALYGCYGLKELHLQNTSPATLGSNAFGNTSSDLVIYVPYSADHSVLYAYQNTSNWSSYASKLQEEPQ